MAEEEKAEKVKESTEEPKEEKKEQETEEQPIELPPVTFENFIYGLYSTAMFQIGFKDPDSGKLVRNLPLARHTIDTIGMLQEKTKGNLTAPESNLVENLLYELRMSYVRAVKNSETENAEGKEAQEGSEASEQESKTEDQAE